MGFNMRVYEDGRIRARQRARVFRNELCSVVIELVHPDNLGALPPSPRILGYKAIQIGLVSDKEVFRMEDDLRWSLNPSLC